MAWVTTKEAAAALGVSEDTIVRRRKAGVLPAQREPMNTGAGFRWLVEIPDDLAGAAAPDEGAAAGPQAGAQPSAAMIEELATLRTRADGLERLLSEISAERDDWKARHAQEQRASAEARRIAETAQRLAEAAQQEAAQARQLAETAQAERLEALQGGALPAGESEHSGTASQERSGGLQAVTTSQDASQEPAARQGVAESFTARLRRWFVGGSSRA